MDSVHAWKEARNSGKDGMEIWGGETTEWPQLLWHRKEEGGVVSDLCWQELPLS